MWAYYSTAMAGVACAVAVLLRKYAAPKVSAVSLIATALAWLTGLSVVALVPIDVYATLSHQETPAISTLWSVSYWSTQVLTWAVIPVLQQYSLSGAFTIGTRLLSALKRNLVFYGIMGALAIIGILAAWLSGHLALKTLPALVFTLSNTYGLIVCILLLGYGLVEIPRIFWRRSFPEKRLRWHYHRVGRAAEKLTDASAELEKVLAIVLATSQQVPRSDVQLRRYMDLLVKYAEEYSPVKLSAVARGKADIDRLEEGDLDYATSVDSMARLRGRMKLAISNFEGCRGEYMSYVRKALELEAVCKARQHGVYAPPSGSTSRAAVAWWWYKCQARPWVQRAGAGVTAAVSAAMVWSEATIATGTSPDLSPFSLMIHSGGAKGEFVSQTLVAAPLAYICSCAYFSLFKLGNFGFYHMVSHATWAYSLLLSGSLLCRFAAPLCFNFLHVIRMNEYLYHGEQMVFIQKMKGMNDVPVLGHNFNTWFPLTITVYCAMLFFNLWEKCASKLFISSRFRFDTERADDEHTSRGARLVQLEQDAMGKGYPLGEGIGLFGVGSSAGAASSGAAGAEATAGATAGASMELNRSVHGSKGNLAGAGGASGANAGGTTNSSKQSSRSGSPARPTFGAWGTAGHGAGKALAPGSGGAFGAGASGSGLPQPDSLHNVLLKNQHGSSDSLRAGSRQPTPAGSEQGSPQKKAVGAGAGPSNAAAEIDGMFASVEGRKSRGWGDSQRLVDASAETSSGGLGGFRWKGAWRDK